MTILTASGDALALRTVLLLGTAVICPAAPLLAQVAAEVAPTQTAQAGDPPTAGPAGNQNQSAAADEGGIEEIIVTAQKRTESLQDVPISIVALGTEKLDQLQAQAFDDYVRFLPSVTYQTAGPGSARVYFRGVSSGENANHSTSQPTVGIYLDEQPITTIQGALDLHLYDIARVEALAGPQGTLYGSSSLAGTIRIITNKPDPSKLEGGVDLELNRVTDGEFGYVAEAFVNVPLSDRIAVRAVGWYDKDAGYIDNVAQSRTYTFPKFDDDGNRLPNDPTDDLTVNNNAFVEKNYNDVETYGGRIALGIELDDDWTITPSLMGQMQQSDGFFGQETGLGGKRRVAQYDRETNSDDWWQAALTIEGKIGDWSLTYSGGYLKRKIVGFSDYSDYSYFYDALFGSGAAFYDNAGVQVDPTQNVVSRPRFDKQSHEIRIASPSDKPLRLLAGAFYQRQQNDIEENYIIEDIADVITVTGTESNIWLTKQKRVDKDYAIFGELAYDITDQLSVTAGARVYKFRNTLVGFFGFAEGYSPDSIRADGRLREGTGEAACNGAPPKVTGTTCTNLDKKTSDTDWLPKVNVTYKVNDDALVYGTFSRGFRPGGINRRGELEPYRTDKLDNYEIGFKTSFADRKLQINGALYQLEWSDIQFSSLGANGLSVVTNAGDARIRGFEFDVTAAPVPGLTLQASGSYNDSKLVTDFCKFENPQQDCSIPGPDSFDADLLPDANEVLAPSGSRLPDTAKFKGTFVGRYEFAVGTSMDAHIQGAVVYEGDRVGDLRSGVRAIVGDFGAYTTTDLSAGVKTGRFSAEIYVTNLFDVNGKTSRSVQCGEFVCGDPDDVTASGGVFYSYIVRPRTVGLKLGTRF